MSNIKVTLVNIDGLLNFMCKDSLRDPLSNAERSRSIAQFVVELFKLH